MMKSRRAIERAYIPGTLFLNSSYDVCLVIGWNSKVPTSKWYYRHGKVKTHFAIILRDGRIEEVNWEMFLDESEWVYDILAGENTSAFFE